MAALPNILDPMYWIGPQGLFAAAVLPTILVIVFVETGLLFPLLPVDTSRPAVENNLTGPFGEMLANEYLPKRAAR